MNNKKHISLSINPSYYCNFRCSFCYLSPEQLGDKKRLDLQVLGDRIDEVMKVYDVVHVDLYGGEPQLLPESYLLELKILLLSRGIGRVNVNTNLSVMTKMLDDEFYDISVSFDFNARKKVSLVNNNLNKLKRPFSIVSVATNEMMKKSPRDVWIFLSMLPLLMSYEVKPYSPSVVNSIDLPNLDFENYIKELIIHRRGSDVVFVNEENIKAALECERNAFSNDHIYITPSGDFAVLEFDKNGNEHFMPVESIEAYQKWTVREETRVRENEYCGKCRYLGNCLSEHLKEVKNLNDSCNGGFSLLNWGGNYYG